MESLAIAIRELARREHRGAPAWPGLTVDRHTTEVEICRPAKSPAVLGILVCGDHVGYRVLGGLPQPDRFLLEATPVRPCLWLTLPIDATAVRQVSSEVTVTFVETRSRERFPETGELCALDDDLAGGVLRFLRSLTSPADHNVLAPLYMREIAYRVLQGDQGARVLHGATCRKRDPVSDTIDYIASHLAEPMTVDTLSQRVHLSPSAFSRMFRDATGHAPYQFVKNTRMQRARELITAGVGVSSVAQAVGFVSVSHFIKQFRERFGITPGAYAAAGTVKLHVDRPAV